MGYKHGIYAIVNTSGTKIIQKSNPSFSPPTPDPADDVIFSADGEGNVIIDGVTFLDQGDGTVEIENAAFTTQADGAVLVV